jgi:hypothetical protein
LAQPFVKLVPGKVVGLCRPDTALAEENDRITRFRFPDPVILGKKFKKISVAKCKYPIRILYENVVVQTKSNLLHKIFYEFFTSYNS